MPIDAGRLCLCQVCDRENVCVWNVNMCARCVNVSVSVHECQVCKYVLLGT